jgi:hypothetical protein
METDAKVAPAAVGITKVKVIIMKNKGVVVNMIRNLTNILDIIEIKI